jgi:c(7)-type cytochrome triheme protein
MRNRLRSLTLASSAALALTLGVSLAAQSLPRLPKDYRFSAASGSPGPVVFSHETHLATQERPDCLTCHPRLFRTLEPGATADGQRVQHALMDQKKQCGACHNGEAAAGLDDCAHCHRM